MIERAPVTFTSDRWQLKGYLFRTVGHGRSPCLVMCHGFTGTMDRLFDGAEQFCDSGFSVLVFDYRNFGESGGKPRQVISLREQRQDIAAAVAFARAQPDIDADRIMLWGTSLGGAHVVVQAAEDQRIAAVIAQVPFNGFPKTVEGRSGRETRRLLSAMVWDWLRGLIELAPAYIPAVGRPGELAVMASDAAAEEIEAMAGTGTLWQNKVAPRVLLEMMFHQPSNYAPQVSCPLLVTMAENDREAPPDLIRPLADKAPRGEIRSYPIRHFEIYKPEIRRAIIADQIRFLQARVDGMI
jgi:uncharacterized protein